MRRILVSGVGRSATTLLYRQIAQALRLAGGRTNFRYEPYLWNIRAPRMRGQTFGLASLHPFGIDTHLATPLFLPGAGQPQHDRFLDHLFDAPFDGATEEGTGLPPDAHLVKVIRGSGRLRAALDRFPDLRIVACLRNPLDTVNSSLAMFSFFGEEYHADDRPRFKAELLARPQVPGIDAASLPDGRRSVEWAAAWVRAFTEETRAVARDHAGRVLLVPHEALTADPTATIRALAAFLDLPEADLALGFDRPAGPRMRGLTLTLADIAHLLPLVDRYRAEVLDAALGPAAAASFVDALRERHAGRTYRLPLAGADAERMGAALHELMAAGEVTPFLRAFNRPDHPTAIPALRKAGHPPPDHPEARAGTRPRAWPVAEIAALKRGRTFGVVITTHDTGPLAVDAVLSCLDQTLPFDEIVVVDDASTDDTPELLAELERRFAHLTLIRLKTNLGPAAARHLGLVRIGTDFVTSLDGDDLFWPTKLEGEARALEGDLSRVAFSDILLAESADAASREETGAYDGLPSAEVHARLLARTWQIPRDMTFARSSHLAAGGHDLTGRLYEDWEWKLRLAALGGQTWHRSAAYAGTVYNRAAPGLSERPRDDHARALVTIFLRASGGLAPAAVLPAFDGALRFAAKRPAAVAARAWLAALVAEDRFEAEAVAAFGGARWLPALPDDAFAALFEDLAARAASPPAVSPAVSPGATAAPLVSILTVVKDDAPGLAATLRSVFAQTWPDYEVIVQDGASTDGTADVIRVCKGWIDTAESAPDSGIYDAMNRALARARGEWVLFLNAGDVFADGDVLARIAAHLGEGVDILAGQALDADTGEVHEYLPPEMFWAGSVNDHQATFVRRGLARDLGFDASLRIAGDLDFFARARARGARALDIPVPVVRKSFREGASTDFMARFAERSDVLLRHYGSRHPVREALERSLRTHLNTTYAPPKGSLKALRLEALLALEARLRILREG